MSCVSRWVAGNNQVQHPASVGITCPECSMKGAFTTKRRLYDEHRDTLSCSALCPSCNTHIHLWIVDAVGSSKQTEREEPMIYMMPGTKDSVDLSDLPDTVPPKVAQYCASTMDVYSSGNLTATTVLVQSALESIFDDFLPVGNSRTTLPKLIQDSIDSMNLNAPLNEIAISFRPEGTLDSIFSSSQHTTKESADAMMALLDKLITYLYVMPGEFATLQKEFTELNRTTNLARKGLDDGRQDAA
ncbi:MAG: hypothetical protein AB8B84_17865 [Granulosicoccus sp.]